MTTAEADALLDRLTAAGVDAGYQAFSLPDRNPLPDETDLLALPIDQWDAEFRILWPVLPDGHPDNAVLDPAHARYHADPAFAAALEAAYDRRVERQCAAADDLCDWTVPVRLTDGADVGTDVVF